VLSLHLTILRSIALISQYKYLIVLPIAIAEGPTISAISGFLSSTHILNVFVVLPLLMVADLIGDSIYYLIGATGGKKLIEKYGHKFKMPEARMNKVKQSFEQNGGKILLFGKTQPYGSLVLLLSGAAKMDFKNFLFYNFIGTVPKTILFFMVGYLFGYGVINNFVSYAGEVSIALGIFLLIGYFFLVRRLSAKENII